MRRLRRIKILATLGPASSDSATIRKLFEAGADLFRIKLASGLANAARAKDLAHVVDLIQRVPLTKAFAAKLPPHLRAPFKKLIDTVNQD